MNSVIVQDIVDRFNLKVITGDEGLKKEVTVSDLSRPGLEIAGYFTYYPAARVQLMGRTELSFLETLDQDTKRERMHKLCANPETPCICISRNLDIPDPLIDAAKESGTPVLQSSYSTTKLSSKLTNLLEERLAPTTTMHGVLVDCYGIGVLIVGSSGIGKSEAALELVKRGHRMVADDAVEIRQTQEDTLIGSAPDLIKHLLEIRGLGIINVMTLFGAGAIRNFKKIALVVRLENWETQKEYDRLGLDEDKMKIMDIDLPLITIPVRPGRNLAVIIEVAAMNFRLKRMGYNAAVQFTQQLMDTVDDADDIV